MTSQRTYSITSMLLIIGLFCLSAEAESSRRKQIQQTARGSKPARQARSTPQAPRKKVVQRPASTPAQQPRRQTGAGKNLRPPESSARRQGTTMRNQSQQMRSSQLSPQKVVSPSLNKLWLPIYQANKKVLRNGDGQQATSNVSKDVKYLNTKRIIRYVGKGSGANPSREHTPPMAFKTVSQLLAQGSQSTPVNHEDSSTLQKRKEIIRGNRSIGTRIGRLQVHHKDGFTRFFKKGNDISAVKSPNHVFQTLHPARSIRNIHNRHVSVFKKAGRKEIIVNKRNWERQTQHYRCRSREVHVSYIDRPHVYSKRYHHIYKVIGSSGRRYYRIIGPRSLFTIYYQRRGLSVCVSLRPYYHRKYVFVSLGGQPLRTTPWIRYYWYGWHPYEWYGYYPLAYRIEGDTYNYYTYNYGDNGVLSSQVAGYDNTGIAGYRIGSTNYMNVVDKQISSGDQEVTPAAAGPADIQFEQGVEAFDVNDFAKAADHFQQATQYAPEDNILALAYVQALFADNRYDKAAEVLREVLGRIQILEEGLFYPRGLYADDEILFAQIDALMRQAEMDSGNKDLQLLLGYQLMGIGEIDLAKQPLENAGRDGVNSQGAKKLISLLDIIEQQAKQADAVPNQGQETN